jgi:ubiquinone/menaquinone biosynthesis C-methylase UbiE
LGPAVLRRGISLLSDIFALTPPMVKPELALDGKLVGVKGSMLFRFAYGASKFIPKGARFKKARKGIDRAIRQEGIFHLWFHPISFAWETKRMLGEFEQILEYACQQKKKGALDILTLQEADRAKFGNINFGLDTDKDRFNPKSIALHNDRSISFRREYEGGLSGYHLDAFRYGRKKIEFALQNFLNTLNNKSRILDVGCGTGFFLNLIRGKGFNCVGIDVSENMLRQLKDTYSYLTVQIADARKIPYRDNCFDAVVSIETLRYFSNRDSLLKEIFRVTKPAGSIFITAAPLLSCNIYGLFNTFCRFLRLNSVVSCFQSFETAGSLNNRIEKAGFEDIAINGYFFGPYFLFDKMHLNIGSFLMKKFERIDDKLSKISLLRNFSNHLIVTARKPCDARS